MFLKKARSLLRAFLLVELMEGILLINKPVGPSSFDVVRRVRRLSGIKKVGHAGTLDPLASGLMVVCLGRYTKLADILTGADKIYEATFCLGTQTSTDDGEGEIITNKPTDHLSVADVELALSSFRGSIKQIPPQFSAIKINGQRAYALARSNQTVSLTPRDVHCYQISITEHNLPEITVHIHCSKGTYVRSLARDIGQLLKVGAYAKAIHRVQSGAYRLAQAIALEDLAKDTIADRLLKNGDAIAGLETIEVTPEIKDHLICGRKFEPMPAIAHKVAVAVCESTLVAIMKQQEGRTVVSRVL